MRWEGAALLTRQGRAGKKRGAEECGVTTPPSTLRGGYSHPHIKHSSNIPLQRANYLKYCIQLLMSCRKELDKGAEYVSRRGVAFLSEMMNDRSESKDFEEIQAYGTDEEHLTKKVFDQER